MTQIIWVNIEFLMARLKNCDSRWTSCKWALVFHSFRPIGLHSSGSLLCKTHPLTVISWQRSSMTLPCKQWPHDSHRKGDSNPAIPHYDVYLKLLLFFHMNFTGAIKCNCMCGAPHIIVTYLWASQTTIARIYQMLSYSDTMICINAISDVKRIIQSREKVLVRGCEKFLPALA